MEMDSDDPISFAGNMWDNHFTQSEELGNLTCDEIIDINNSPVAEEFMDISANTVPINVWNDHFTQSGELLNLPCDEITASNISTFAVEFMDISGNTVPIVQESFNFQVSNVFQIFSVDKNIINNFGEK